MSFRATLLSLLLFAAPAGFAADAAAGMSAVRLAKIPARMKAFVDEGKAPGYVTLVARHGHIASLEAVGFQDLETRTPMRASTIFQIMSMSKPITCIGAMILVDDGLISLIDPVGKYLPEFQGMMLKSGAKPSRPIQIRDLMTHSAGLANPPSVSDSPRHTLADAVKMVAKLPLEFEPGSQWKYSNGGIATLGRIIEMVSGQSFEQFMAARVFVPLEMKDTAYFIPQDKETRVASVYTEDHGKLKRDLRDIFRHGNQYAAPEGGLYSTAPDLYRLYQMMLNKGTFGGQRILSAAAVELMTTPQLGDKGPSFAPGLGAGLGWAVVREQAGMFRYQSIGAFGHGGAFRTYGWIDPAKDLIGVILLQRTNGGGDVAEEINSFMALSAAAIER